MSQEIALRALKEVDFDWTMHIQGVWRDPVYDVSHLHQAEREAIINELERHKRSDKTASPLGMVIVGSPGSGKTHLLSAVRQHAAAQGFGFVLVDMTDVRDFWDTVLQGYLTSLMHAESDGIPQFQKLIASLISFTGSSSVRPAQIANAPLATLIKATKIILNALLATNKELTLKFQDVIRAVLLLNSNNIEAFNVGNCWLQGLEIEPEDKTKFAFLRASMSPVNIVEGLSWLMSLRGVSVLAIDQLDAIVTQHHLASGQSSNSDLSRELLDELSNEQRRSKAIIEGISGGLMALRDKTYRTLIILSCLETTWEILNQGIVQSFQHRFQDEIRLRKVLNQDAAEAIVASRLQQAYNQFGYSPPYPTYPFTASFFDTARQQFPRTILQRCDKHRNQCVIKGSIQEIDSFNLTTPSVKVDVIDQQLDRDFATLKQQIQIIELLQEQYEDERLGMVLQTACYCLVKENPVLDSVDVSVEVERAGRSGYLPLHVRIRLVFREQRDREKHFCFRALQRTNATAYQNRLKAAMTASGIDRALSFRRLMVIRTNPVPKGAISQQLTQSFRNAGGLLKQPSEDELRSLAALYKLKRKQDPNFDQWLRDRRPVSQLPLMRDVVTWLFEDALAEEENIDPVTPLSDIPSPDPQTADQNYSEKVSRVQPTIPDKSSASRALQVGVRLLGQQVPITIRLGDLDKHVVILAGSGSGKTVLLRRIVEEAAMMGVPAIVIDGANDLARLGDRWSTPPNSWQDQDHQKAERYHQQTQVLVWTPGREAGNPLSLKPLPDFAAVRNDHDEFNQAIDMARDSLQAIVAPGNSSQAKIKQGVLRNALKYFAEAGGGSLEEFALFLSELPLEADGGIGTAQKKAREIADLLNAEMANNPLLRQSGSALDPAVLFGLHQVSDRTVLSVINFIGLPNLNSQQQFLNQLAMTLFTWIKKNPAPIDQPLRGLLVIDEAKDFVPSGHSTACKASLIRLAAQARKYGLGLIFATQAPKSIDHNIIANCTTQFYGRANSPTAIEVIQAQLSQRGGNGQDIASLERGQFYIATEALIPTKILAPLCLSYHPPTPLDEAEVMKRAIASRKLSFG